MVNSPTFVGRARRSESRFHNDFAAGRGWGGWGGFEAVEGFVTSLAMELLKPSGCVRFGIHLFVKIHPCSL